MNDYVQDLIKKAAATFCKKCAVEIWGEDVESDFKGLAEPG